jgi:hypothetical protein
MYSNSASTRSRNFWTASGFCASQSTILRSRIRGTKSLMVSSQPFFPGQALSIFPPPAWTPIFCGFRPAELLSVATSSSTFLFWRQAALAMLSLFPVLPGGPSICTLGGQQSPRYGMDSGAEGIIHGTCEGMDPIPEGIIHGTGAD